MGRMYQIPIPPLDPHPNDRGLIIDGEWVEVKPEAKYLDITSQTEEEKGE